MTKLMGRTSPIRTIAALSFVGICAGVAMLAGSARATSDVGGVMVARPGHQPTGPLIGRAAAAPWLALRASASSPVSPGLLASANGLSAPVAPPPADPSLGLVTNASVVAPLSPIPGVAAFAPLGVGDEGPPVVLLQGRLVALGFRPGGNEGYFGWTTYQAVLAFQKLEGIERTGDVDAETWAHLSAPSGYRPPLFGKHLRVDTDLERQVMFIANADGPGTQVVLNTSSGGNYAYFNPETKTEEFASTPTGTYRVYRTVDGDDKGPLGVLYRPQYFSGGYAIHGSGSVPAYPASHGCLRVSNDDMDWLWTLFRFGTPVAVYDSLTSESYAARRAEELDGFRGSYLGDERGLEAV